MPRYVVAILTALGSMFLLLTLLTPKGCNLVLDSPTPASEPKRLIWNLADGHEINRVGWPPSVTDDIWFLEGPLTVHLIFPGGEEGDVTFEKAQLRREGKELRVVSLQFPAETIEQCYARAAALARQWKITDTTQLEDWHRTRGYSADQHAGYVALGRSDLPQPRGIQLRHAYLPKQPWGVSFGFGYVADPSSQPAP